MTKLWQGRGVEVSMNIQGAAIRYVIEFHRLTRSQREAACRALIGLAIGCNSKGSHAKKSRGNSRSPHN